jgi:hypothetical protein
LAIYNVMKRLWILLLFLPWTVWGQTGQISVDENHTNHRIYNLNITASNDAVDKNYVDTHITTVSITATAPVVVTPSPLTGTGVISLSSSSITVAGNTVALGGTVTLDQILANGGTTLGTGLIKRTGANALAIAVAGTDYGTVTSVAQTVPSWLTISGSPITTSGTLAIGVGSAGAHLYLGNNTASSATLALVQPVIGDLSAIAASTLVGNPTASSAAPTTITLGTNLSFSGSVLNATGGGGTPGGANTDIQYNNSGAFGGDANFTYTTGTGIVQLSNSQNGATYFDAINSNTGTSAQAIYVTSNGTNSSNYGTLGTAYSNGALTAGFAYLYNDGPGIILNMNGTTGVLKIVGNGALEKTRIQQDGAISVGNTVDPGAGSINLLSTGGYFFNNDTALKRTAAGVLEVDNGTSAQWAALNVGNRDAVTNTLSTGLTLGHNSTGTVANSFGESLLFNLQDSTTADQPAAKVSALWTNATHASNSAAVTFQTVQAGGSLNERVRIGGGVMVGLAGLGDPGTGYINVSNGFQVNGGATSGALLMGNGTYYVPSTYTYPTSSAQASYALASNGTNIINKAVFITNSSTAQQTGFAADTYLTGSTCTIYPGDWQVGGNYKCTFDMAKTAAGTAAPVITIRVGTAGTTADTAAQTVTWAAGTAAADTGEFTVVVSFNAVGSSAKVASYGKCDHNLVATGLTSTGAGGAAIVSNAASATFSSSSATKIGLSFNGGTSFAGTCNVVQSYYANP